MPAKRFAGGLIPGIGKVVLNPLGREIVLSQSTEYGPDPPEIAVICISPFASPQHNGDT